MVIRVLKCSCKLLKNVTGIIAVLFSDASEIWESFIPKYKFIWRANYFEQTWRNTAIKTFSPIPDFGGSCKFSKAHQFLISALEAFRRHNAKRGSRATETFAEDFDFSGFSMAASSMKNFYL